MLSPVWEVLWGESGSPKGEMLIDGAVKKGGKKEREKEQGEASPQL